MSQINVNTIADSSGSNAITYNKILGPSAHFRSVIFPENNGGTYSWDGSSGSILTPDYSVNIGNGITFTVSNDNSGSNELNYTTVFTLSGFEVGGIYEIHAHINTTRTSNASVTTPSIHFREDSSIIAKAIGSMYTQTYSNAGLSLIRDYTSAVPSSVQLQFGANHSNYPTTKGSGFTIKRIA